MADPFSTTASIITLVHLTGSLISLGYEYIATVKTASKDLRELVGELQSLGKVLMALQEYVNTDKRLQPTALKTLNGQNGPLLGCILELKTLQSKLELKPEFLRNVVKILKWPLKEQETLQHITRIQRQKSLFILALTTDNIILSRAIEMFVRNTDRIVQNLQTESTALVGELKEYVKSTGISLRRLEERIQDQGSWRQMHTDEKRRSIHDWLYPDNFDTKHLEISSRRQKNTGVWILETQGFCDWLKNDDQKYRLLWGYGIPGAGKTFLSSVIIDHFLDQQPTTKHGVAYIYFDYKEQDRQTPNHVLSSLLKQLLGQVDVISAEVETLYDNLERCGRRPTFRELCVALIAVSGLFDRVFLIFDALDECDQLKQRKKLLPLFHELGKNGINLFLTSRQYPTDIQNSLNGLSKIELSAKKEDIDIYIRQKIDENDQAKHLIGQSDFKDRIVSELVNCAQGMFLLVHFHLEHLCQQTTVRQVLTELNKLKSTSTFTEEKPLDPTYDRVMWKLRGQTKHRTDLALTILSWLVKAKRTLTVNELQSAVSIMPNQYDLDRWNVPDKTTLLDVCASLVIIDEKSNMIRLAHYTVQEYLLRNSIITEKAQVKLAVACTTFLSFNVFNVPSRDTRPQPSLRVQRFNKMITRPTLRFRQERELWARFKSYPLLKYAARYLPSHLKECDDDSLTEAVLKLVRSPGNLSSYFDAAYSQNPLGEFDYFVYRENQPIFHAACTLGYLPVVNLLLGGRVDLSVRDINGRTALLEAASWGSEQVSRVLIEYGADISAVDTNGQNSLHLAASNGHDGVVKLLLEKGAKPSTPDENRLTPLHHSAFKGSEAVVRLLIEKSANPLVLDIDGKTPLHRAASQGHESVVRLLLEKGVPAAVNIFDNTGSTPLHLSVSKGHETITELLLNSGARILLADSMGQTALHIASSEGYDDIIRLLLRNLNSKQLGISKQDLMGFTALHHSAHKGSEISVRLLIEKGADPRVLENNGRTPLHLAASRGHHGIVQFLLDNGMDISIPDNTGSTPLHLTIFGGHYIVARLLLNIHPDLSTLDKQGRTPLHIAASKQDIDMIRLLLRSGADFSFTDHNGRTLLHLLTIYYKLSPQKELIHTECKPLIQMLLDNGVGISATDKNGWTALHHAVSGFLGARDNHPGLELLKLLLEKGADPSIQDINGQTVLHVAASSWNHDAISILAKKRADISILDLKGRTPLHLAANDIFQWYPSQKRYDTIRLLLGEENNGYQDMIRTLDTTLLEKLRTEYAGSIDYEDLAKILENLLPVRFLSVEMIGIGPSETYAHVRTPWIGDL